METICIQVPGVKYLLLEASMVISVEAGRQVCHFTLTDGRTVTGTKYLGYYKPSLVQDFGFWEISKSLLVNSRHVVQYEPREGLLTLSNDQQIVVPKKCVRQVNTIFKTLYEQWEIE